MMLYARIERYPVVYNIFSPQKRMPHLWVAWSEKTGGCIGTAVRKQSLESSLEQQGIRHKTWLRIGDNGKNRYWPLFKWWIRSLYTKGNT